MKLTRLHIENFGKLSNFNYDFSDGINTVCEENSFGKTTLGSFIKVMFFGFDKETSRKGDRERSKYKPWQGGTYGGTIDFDVNGKHYEMTRVFKDRAADDEFVLRDLDTLLESRDYTKDGIGKEIFAVDGGSFERTMFISQNDYDYGDKNDIDAKIGNLVDNTDDMNNYDAAIARIEASANLISGKRGGKGKLDQLKIELSDLQNDVKRKNTVVSSIHNLSGVLEGLTSRIETKSNEIKRLSDSIDELSELQQMAKDKVEYKELLDSFSHFNTIDSKERTFFNNVIPNEMELNQNLLEADKLTEYRTKIRENKLTEDEEIKLISLQRKYENSSITDIDFDSVEALIKKCSEDKTRINELDLTNEEKELYKAEERIFSIGFKKATNDEMIQQWDSERQALNQDVNSLRLTVTEVERIKELDGVYGNNPPKKDYYDEIKRRWTVDRQKLITDLGIHKLSQYDEQEYRRLSEMFSEKRISSEEIDANLNKVFEINNCEQNLKNIRQKETEAKDRLSKISILNPLFDDGLVLAIIGLIAAFIAPNMEMNGDLIIDTYPNIRTVGYILMGIGAVMAIVSFFVITNRKKKQEQLTINSLAEELSLAEKQKYRLIGEINSWLSEYGKQYDENVIITINNLHQEYRNYQRLISQLDANAQNTSIINNSLKKIDNEVEKSLAEYGYPFEEQNVSYYLNKITKEYDELVDLVAKKNDLEQKQKASLDRIKAIENNCQSYLAKYEINSSSSSYSASLYDLQRRYNAFVQLSEKASNKELEIRKNEHSQLVTKLEGFFKTYLGEAIKEDDYYSRFSELKNDSKDIALLQDKNAKYKDALISFNSVKDSLSKYIRGFSFTVSSDIKAQLNEMQDHYHSYSENLEPFVKSKDRKEAFEKSHPYYNELKVFDQEVDEESIKELNSRRNALATEIDGLRKEWDNTNGQLEELNNAFNDICDKEGQITTSRELKAELESRLSVLRKAGNLLKKAKDSLNARYTAPLNNSLSKYFDILAKGSDLNITMNVNKELIIKSNGIETTENNLSEGYKDIVDICYRFALIDAMYKNEQPIVILDDPFINLDQEKIANGMKLLNEVAKDKQILYLTCHESRTSSLTVKH